MSKSLAASLRTHRVQPDAGLAGRDVRDGEVRYAPAQSIWFSTFALGTIVGGFCYVTSEAILVFLFSTALVLLLGHTLGSHRKFIHNSFQCPKWLEYLLVYCGVLVGIAGPIGLLKQHELRDYAQRQSHCHPYLRHGTSFWRDAWWQLHCQLILFNPPTIHIEAQLAGDRFFRFLESTWRLQQIPVFLLLFVLGGWPYLLWGGCARVLACNIGHWLIGYFAHNRGELHIEVVDAAVQGRNIRYTSLLTMGECWHNNHHAFPASAKLGLRPGEWDPGWWTLRMLRRLGLVWDCNLPEHLPPRPELRLHENAGAPGPAHFITPRGSGLDALIKQHQSSSR